MGMKRINEGFYERTEAYKRRAKGGPKEKFDENHFVKELGIRTGKEEKHRKLGEPPKYGEKNQLAHKYLLTHDANHWMQPRTIVSSKHSQE